MPIILAESDPDLWPLELDEALDSVSVDAPDRAVGIEGESRMTWREGAELVKALSDEDGRFVVTEGCTKRLDRNPHPDPADMVQHVERLKDLALRWSKSVGAGGLGGDFVEIARTEHDLIISRHDEPMRRAKLQLFQHDGRSYSREHHVKVNDHTTPDRVGRIYFALDEGDNPPRPIVDHIGLKLSPYVKR